MFITDTKRKIIDYIRQNGSATRAQLEEVTGITSIGISQHLKGLVDSGQLQREGKPPKVTYYLGKEQHKINFVDQVKNALLEDSSLPQDLKTTVLNDLASKLHTLPKATTKTMSSKPETAGEDSKTISLNAEPAEEGSKTISLKAEPAGEGSKTISLKAEPAGEGSKTISLKAEPAGEGSKTISLKAEPAGEGSKTISLKAETAGEGSKTISLKAETAGEGSKTISLKAETAEEGSKTISSKEDLTEEESMTIPPKLDKLELSIKDVLARVDSLSQEFKASQISQEQLQAELTSLKAYKQSNELVNRGVELYDQNEIEMAIIEFTKAIEIDPSNAQAYMWRGIISYYSLEEDKLPNSEIIGDFNKSIELYGRDYRAFMYLCFIYYDLKDYDQSWEYLYKGKSLGWKDYYKHLEYLKKDSGREK